MKPMNTTLLRSLALCLGSLALGAALATLSRPAPLEYVDQPLPSPMATEASQLRDALARARARIAKLETALDLATPRAATAALNRSDDANPALELRIKDLERALTEARRQAGAPSDAEMQELLAEARVNFDTALADRDAAKALKVMSELATLDERAYPQLLEMWTEIRARDWLGLNWQQRPRWASADFLHWVLDPARVFSDPEALAGARREAIWSFGSYEPDMSSQATTLAALLRSLAMPGELAESKDRRRWRQRGTASEEFYRMALDRVAQLPSGVASEILQEIAVDPGAPADVRRTALRGLGRQGDDASLHALELATRDRDPAVAKTADLALKRRAPPLDGWLVTSITEGSQASKLGLKSGAIITRYNGLEIRNDRQLIKAIREAQGSVTLEVFQHGRSESLTLKGGERIGVNGEGVTQNKP